LFIEFGLDELGLGFFEKEFFPEGRVVFRGRESERDVLKLHLFVVQF
jgi:hypothetical protein